MIIDKKVVYVKKKETFEPLIATIPVGLNPIVFIEDTREMWTCGTYFSIGYPGIEVSESSGSVKVEIGNSFFMMSTAGESLSIRKGDGNRIILSSNALNRVDTEYPLKWDNTNRKLLHEVSGVATGSYGQSTNLSNASVFSIPNIMVDSTGHVTYAENHTVEIRDYVEQLAPSNTVGDKNILLSYNLASNYTDTSQARKANGLYFNDSTQKLTTTGGLISNGAVQVNKADLTVVDGYIIGKLKGDVEGQATPKIHLSLKPEYGGASSKLYGHVILQDILTAKPNPSSANENVNDTNIAAFAASPLMVWNAIQTAKDYADSILGSNNAMLYKGAIEAGTTSPGTFTPGAEVGNTYVVTFGNGSYSDSIGYINGEPVEIGDLLICKESTLPATSLTWAEVKKKWTFVQTNTTGVVSGPSRAAIGQLAIFNSTTGKLITGMVNGSVGQLMAIGSSGLPTWIDKPDRLNYALKFKYNNVEFVSFDGHVEKSINFIAGDNMFITPDAQGNFTFAADPGSDTVNTAGATNLINKKLFLIGAESQTESPQTYSNQYVYVGTDNKLYSNGKEVSTTDHTHLYAGSATAGGPALQVAINPSGLLAATYGSYGGLLQDSTGGPVSGMYTNRIKILHNNSVGYYTELAQSFTSTAGLWHRRMVNGALSAWVAVLDTANYKSYLDPTYVSKDGDTMTGTLTVPTLVAASPDFRTALHVWRKTNAGYSTIDFYNGTTKTLLGSLGYLTADTPIMYSVAGTPYNLLHAGNYDDYAVRVSGGSTISNSTYNNQLHIWRNVAGGASVIGYYSGTTKTLLGTIGFTTANAPIWYKTDNSTMVNFLHAENYNSYSPTLTGGGATGTWNINILGNADTSTALVGRTFNNSSEINFSYSLWSANGAVADNTAMNYAMLLQVGSSFSRGWQIWSDRNTKKLYWRQAKVDMTGWDVHQLLLDTSNYSSYALPLSGGTLTGGGKIDSNGNLTLQQNTGSNATGMFWSNLANTATIAGIGTHTGGDVVSNIYMGWGANPWDGATNFRVNSTNAYYKNNIMLNASNYNGYALPLSGGTMSGTIASTASDPALRVMSGSTNKTAYGWRSDYGSYIYSYNSGKYLGIKDDGTPHYHGSTLWHAGNSNKTDTTWSASQITFSSTNFPKDGAPRANISPYSIKVWDSYGQAVVGGDSYGVVLEVMGRAAHWDNQLYFQSYGHNIWHRASSYNDSSWSYGWARIAMASEITDMGNLCVKKAGDTMSGLLNWSMNGVSSSIGSQNAGWLHFNTNSANGFYFSKNVSVAGDIFGGTSYNRRLQYRDEMVFSNYGSQSSASVAIEACGVSTWATSGGGFQETYGNSLHIRGNNTWNFRLDFGTNGNMYLYRGINTTSMTYTGMLWHSGNLTGNQTGHYHNSIRDIYNGTTTTFAYGKSTVPYASYTYLAGWNGYELRAINKTDFATAGHTHSNYWPIANGSSSAVAHYSTTATTSGILVRIPYQWSAGHSWMISFTLRLYQSYNFYDIVFSGYNYHTNKWYSPMAKMIAGSGSIAAKMGWGADGYLYVWTSGGNYTGATVFNVNNGYTQYNWSSGWVITNDANCPNVQASWTLQPPVYVGDSVSKSDVAARLGRGGDTSVPMTFNWSGQSGQPTWLWGGTDGTNMYVYNPSNFSVNYANSAGKATYADYLPTKYNGGDQPNPQTYFNSGIGLRVAMTGYKTGAWTDTLWINGYAGGDVPYCTALHFIRNGTPRMWIGTQTSTSTGYGSIYEVITTYNAASMNVGSATKLQTARSIFGQSFNGTDDVTGICNATGFNIPGGGINFLISNGTTQAFRQSVSENGGMTVGSIGFRWGKVYVNANNRSWVTFSYAFGRSFYSAQVTMVTTDYGDSEMVGVYGPTTSGMYIVNCEGYARDFYYLAIGWD